MGGAGAGEGPCPFGLYECLATFICFFFFFVKKANLVNYNHKGLSTLKC